MSNNRRNTRNRGRNFERERRRDLQLYEAVAWQIGIVILNLPSFMAHIPANILVESTSDSPSEDGESEVTGTSPELSLSSAFTSSEEIFPLYTGGEPTNLSLFVNTMSSFSLSSSQSGDTGSSSDDKSSFSLTTSISSNSMEDPFDSPAFDDKLDINLRSNLLDESRQLSSVPPSPSARSRHISESSIGDDSLTCDLHKLSTSFICKDCSKDICRLCITDNHENHTFEPAITGRELFQKITELTPSMTERIAECQRQRNSLHRQTYEASEKIRSCCRFARSLIDDREKTLLGEVLFNNECRTRIINSREKDAQEAMDKSNEMTKMLAENITKKDGESVYQARSDATKFLQSLEQDLNKFPTIKDESVTFVPPSQEFFDKLKHVGRIETSSNVATNTCNNLQQNVFEDNFEDCLNLISFSTGWDRTYERSADFDVTRNAISPNPRYTNQGLSGIDVNGISNYSGMNQQTRNSTYSNSNSQQYHPFQSSFSPADYFRSSSAPSSSLPAFPVAQNNATSLSSLPTPTETSDFSMLPFRSASVPNSSLPSPRTPGALNWDFTINSLARDLVNMEMHPNVDRPLIDYYQNIEQPFPVSFHTKRNYARIRRPVVVFGREGNNNGEFCRLWGVCCDSESNLYVADRSNNRIQVFRSDGTFVTVFGSLGSERDQFNRPAGLAIDLKDRLVICDKDNHRVKVVKKDGTFVTAFGGRGSAPGKFNYPWDVAVEPFTNNYAISDTRNRRIQYFSDVGSLLSVFGHTNASGSPWRHLDSPRGLWFTPERTLLITEFNNHRIFECQILNKTSARMIRMENFRQCKLYRPQKVVMDEEGNILVSDGRNNRVAVLSRQGAFITSFGTEGKEPGQFLRPSGMALTPDGKIVVVDFENSRIQIF